MSTDEKFRAVFFFFFFFGWCWGKKNMSKMKYKVIHLKNVTSYVMWGLFHKAVYIRIPFKTTRRMTQRSASGWRNSKVKASPKQRRESNTSN